MRAEVRGRNHSWRVAYQDPSDIASPVPVFDQDGIQTDVLMVGAPSGKMIESNLVCSSKEEAVAYAEWLGATEITVRKTATKEEALAKARAVKSRQKESE